MTAQPLDPLDPLDETCDCDDDCSCLDAFDTARRTSRRGDGFGWSAPLLPPPPRTPPKTAREPAEHPEGSEKR